MLAQLVAQQKYWLLKWAHPLTQPACLVGPMALL